MIFALKHANLEMMNLHDFDRTEYRIEVEKSLESNFSSCVDIVKWYIDKKDTEDANDYAQRRSKKMKDSELLSIMSLIPDIKPDMFMSGKCK